MSQDEIYELAKGIIVAGNADGKSDDDIKMDMFAAKVPFSKLNSLFKTISIEEGLIVDPKVIATAAGEFIEQISWDEFEEWPQVQEAVDGIVDRVDGATNARILTLIRAYCREEEIELPKKPRAGGGGGGRGSKLIGAIVDMAIANPEMTKQEAYDAIRPLVSSKSGKHHSNTLYYVNTAFAQCIAVAKSITLADSLKALKAQADPAGSDEAVSSDDDFAEADDFSEEEVA